MALDAGTGSVRAVILIYKEANSCRSSGMAASVRAGCAGSIRLILQNWRNWLASVSVRHYEATIPATAIAAYQACSIREALLFMTVTANQFGPALMLTPARHHEVSELKSCTITPLRFIVAPANAGAPALFRVCSGLPTIVRIFIIARQPSL